MSKEERNLMVWNVWSNVLLFRLLESTFFLFDSSVFQVFPNSKSTQSQKATVYGNMPSKQNNKLLINNLSCP